MLGDVVFELLEEEYGLEPEDFVIERSEVSDQVFFELFTKETIVGFLSFEEPQEQIFKDGVVFYSVYDCFSDQDMIVEKEEAKRILIKEIEKYHIDVVRGIWRNKMKLLVANKKKLQKDLQDAQGTIQKLREKKRELKYAPGGKGAILAQQHFEENI